MKTWLHRLKGVVNYLLPSENYTGKKITDNGWINAFIPIAPYTALFMCGVLFYLGITSKTPRSFLLTPQGFIAALATFWTLVFFVISLITKKKHKSPAIPLLIANFIPIHFFLGLMIFIGFQSVVKKKFEPQYQQISQTVRNKIADDQASLHQKSQDFEKEVIEHQNKVQNSINKMKDFHLGAAERFLQTAKLIDAMYEKDVVKSQKNMAAATADFNNRLDVGREKRKNEWKERQNQQLKTRPPVLGEKIEETPVTNIPSPNPGTFENTSKDENGIYLDLPLAWDRTSWLKNDQNTTVD